MNALNSPPVSFARRIKASVVAFVLASGCLLSAVAPASAQYSVGNPNAVHYSNNAVGGGQLAPRYLANADGTGTGSGSGTDTGDVPTIDYSAIVGEVKQNTVGTLLAVAAVGIGISAMFGAFKWISGFLARKSAGAKS